MQQYYKSRKPDPETDLLEGSKFLYQMSRPPSVNANDVTRSAYPVVKHPTLDDWVIIVDGDIPLHPTVVQAAIDNEPLPIDDDFLNGASDSVKIRNLVRKNTKVAGADLVPARWDEVSIEDLDGWFDGEAV